MNRIDFTLGFGGLIGTSAYSVGTGTHNNGTPQSLLPAAPPPQPSHNAPMIPENILDDLIIRFTMNIPEEERDPTRVCFQVELAHWFLVDRYCSEGANPKMAAMGHIKFQDFAALMFQRTPYLKHYMKNFDSIMASFKEYKQKVPTFGAILMNQELTHVVLVQSFGGHWGFPKGKVNKDEDPTICAVREVKEEVGYEIGDKLVANHYIESESNDHRKSRLYIIRGVDTNFPFHPETQYEIKNIAWFALEELPENKRDPNVVSTRGYSNANFFPVYTYVKRLKRWVADKLQGKNAIQFFRSHPNYNFAAGRFPYSYDNESNNPQGQETTMNLIASHKDYNMKPIGTPSDSTKNPQEKKPKKVTSPKTQYCDVFNNFLMTPPKSDLHYQNQNCISRSLPAAAISNNNSLSHTQKPRNPKRRLFVEEIETAEKSEDQQHLTMLFSQARFNKKVDAEQQKTASVYDKLCSPTWLNFTLNREPILRALRGE